MDISSIYEAQRARALTAFGDIVKGGDVNHNEESPASRKDISQST